jgi:DNA sulfur modification protein DndD
VIFSRLALKNVGVFRGAVEFDLTPSSRSAGRRPIILFGGMNGAGKTTIFESFKLALYGSGAFWPPISQESYESEMRNRLSRHPSTVSDPERASVELDIVHTHLGRAHQYTVRREWNFERRGMKDTLQVLRDGVPLDEVEESLWQDFLWDLIPPGLSRLYFFDGEKIQALADDASGSLQLADSFKSLVGLDLVERLSQDLEFITAKELKRAGASRIGSNLEAAHRELGKLQSRRVSLLSQRAGKQSDLDALFSDVETRERRLASEGGGWAKQREALAKARAEAEAGIGAIDERLGELASGEFPFSLARSLCRRTKARVEKEAEVEQEAQALAYLKSKVLNGLETTARSEVRGFEPNVQRVVLQLLDKILEDSFQPHAVLMGERNLNHLSQKEASRVVHWFEESDSAVAAEVEGLNRRRNEFLLQQLEASAKLAKSPSQDQLVPMVNRLNAARTRLSKAKASVEGLDAEVTRTEREIENYRRRILSIKEEALRLEKQSETLDTAHRVEGALDEFHRELVSSRLTQVTRSLEESFSSLSRKKGWIGEIRVDPETFAVTLVDRHGRILPKERLAAGEKQVYAVALLWALARASGRNLPFIIDTPLGRLDSDHRRSLIKSFLPFASEQVIVFSTDTEVDRTYFDTLAPHVSRSYYLVHDQGMGMTRAEEGYFWKGEQVAVG